MKTYLLTSILVVLVACGGGGSKQDPTSITPPESKRDWLTTDELFENKIPAGPIHNDYFVEIDNSEVIVSDAEHEFSGRLTLSSSSLEGSVSDAFFGEPGIRVFPNIDLEFISDSGNLIPTQRQILKPTNNSYWHILISPGKTWSEDDDGDWSRAAFPFTLIHKQRNEAHNGVATFLYNQAQVSQLRLQVVQETASWSRIDLWAQFPMTYQPEVFDSAETIISEFQLEESGRLPTASWDELSQQVGASTLVGFNSGLIESDISMTGIVMDGIVYHQPCYTRFGNYPFCHQMRQGAFSTTKSMGAAIAMFRLAEKYGDSVFELLIKDYVNVTAPHDGWDNVTFADALNMSTGIGDNSPSISANDIFADENSSKMERWQNANSEFQKLQIAFSYANYRWGPGEIFRYNSTHTYVLAAAMDSFYKSMEGENVNLWEMVIEEVYQPIGIQHAPMTHTIEPDNSKGVPVFYVGLYPTMDDIAKLATLYQNGGGYNGEQLLHAERTAISLYRTEQHGLRSFWGDNIHGNSEYLYSFWSEPLSQDGCFHQVPYMSGYGGNIVALLPNGISVFRYADADAYSATDLVRVSAGIRTICE